MGPSGRDDQPERLNEDVLAAPVVKRSVRIAGHTTSVSMEQPFWDLLQQIAQQRGLSLNALVTEIDGVRRPENSLSSTIRLFVLQQLLRQQSL